MNCLKCGGLLIPDEYWSGGEHCKFTRCVLCGDVDFNNGTHHRKIFRNLKEVLMGMKPEELPGCLRLSGEQQKKQNDVSPIQQSKELQLDHDLFSELIDLPVEERAVALLESNAPLADEVDQILFSMSSGVLPEKESSEP